MSQYYLLQDQKRCIGCMSCEVHCKSNKGLPPGPRLGQIIAVGPKLVGEVPRMGFVFMPCFHCSDPWCVPVCPTGAMRKRPKDGIVYVEQSLCVGCKSCISACPWGAPQWQPRQEAEIPAPYSEGPHDELVRVGIAQYARRSGFHGLGRTERFRCVHQEYGESSRWHGLCGMVA